MLVCTATLAWGVNLPAHTVVIKVCLCVDQLSPMLAAFTNGWFLYNQTSLCNLCQEKFLFWEIIKWCIYIAFPYSSIYSVNFQGTQLYDAKAGGWKDLGMLDVMQVNEKILYGKRHDTAISLVLI